jgi:ATP-dependent DNA helicase RecG
MKESFSGETARALDGPALTEFFQKRQASQWDGLTVTGAKIGELDAGALKAFRRMAFDHGRMSEADLNVSDESLLRRLGLLKEGLLTRAGVLLFHENPKRFFPSAYVKVGYFSDDLEREDEVDGPLITMLGRVEDVIYSKYVSAAIGFEGFRRTETYPVPPPVLREAIVNAVLHRDYSANMHTQIRFYDDRTVVRNAGELPSGRTFEELLDTGESVPRNPSIADTLYRTGITEKWGRGIRLIIDGSLGAGKPVPLFGTSRNSISVTLYFDDGANGNRQKAKIKAILDQTPGLTEQELLDMFRNRQTPK